MLNSEVTMMAINHPTGIDIAASKPASKSPNFENTCVKSRYTTTRPPIIKIVLGSHFRNFERGLTSPVASLTYI